MKKPPMLDNLELIQVIHISRIKAWDKLVGFRISWALFRIPLQKLFGFRNPGSLT